jgi:hypothetical protein
MKRKDFSQQISDRTPMWPCGREAELAEGSLYNGHLFSSHQENLKKALDYFL